MNDPQIQRERPAKAAVPRRVRLVLLLALAVAGLSWLFREPIRARIIEVITLANSAPSADAVEEMIDAASDRARVIQAAWNTGGIVHREVAIRQIGWRFATGATLPGPLESVLLAGALDPDEDVRELALSQLQDRRHPALGSLAAAQLHDPDPDVRRLGLIRLRAVPGTFGVPTVVPLLEDPDPGIVAGALSLLGHWAGQDFGVKLADAVPLESRTTGLLQFRPESLTKTRAGAALARTWWSQHAGEFSPPSLDLPPALSAAVRPLPAGDFSLPTLEGKTVRLSDFRGKVVVLSFWTTWCTACIGEMDALIELQKRAGDRLVVLGISLDAVPDIHGRVGGPPTDSDAAPPRGAARTLEPRRGSQPTLAELRQKVARVVRKRGVNYPVLLDEKNAVGSRFNGGELPTTLVVDGSGLVRRRFVGPRDLAVFEAMLADSGVPGMH